MSDAAKKIVRDWLAQLDAGMIEAEDFRITDAEVDTYERR